MKLKKLVCALMAVAMMFAFAACAGKDKEADAPAAQTTQTEQTPAAKVYEFAVNGVKLAVNQQITEEDLVAKLGEPADKHEEKSCAFEGKDVTYFYNDYEITVAQPDGQNGYIYSILLRSDALATPEGLSLGSTEDKVKELYPEAAYADPFYTCEANGMVLSIKVEEGFVQSIEYTVLVENAE